jgi:DNA polymerase-3 subunit epsilon
MYLIIDTETSGLFDFRAAADAPGQPRLASIAMLICDADLRLISAHSSLIYPEGWVMAAEAERVNGLSQDFLLAHGEPILDILVRYRQAVLASGCTVIAHNAQYDTKVMRGEMRRAGMSDLYSETRHICTMQALTDILAIPSPRGRGFKWPKLAEAVERCLGREHVGAHGCLQDALACLDLARWLKERGLLPAPAAGLAA